ncbi:MAG: tetratricopeptide repeat protein [bacterium]
MLSSKTCCKKKSLPFKTQLKLTFVALVFQLTSVGFGSELISAKTDSLIRAGIRLSVQQSFDEAQAIFSELQHEMPDNPVGYFFQAAVLQTQMMDKEIYDQEAEFVELIEKSISFSKARIKKVAEDPWAYFFLGSSLGYLAFQNAKQKQFNWAFQVGMKSVQALEMALKKDSTLYDAYLGLGTYKYYRSKLSRHFKWLPFVKDDRRAGISMLKIAIKKSRYSRYSAMNSFCWIALVEEQYEQGWQLAERALMEFPQSRVFLWCAAKLADKMERWPEAIRFYRQILASFKSQNLFSPYNEAVCRKNLLRLYLQQEDFDLAEQECAKIQALKVRVGSEKRVADVLKEFLRACQRLGETAPLGDKSE